MSKRGNISQQLQHLLEDLSELNILSVQNEVAIENMMAKYQQYTQSTPESLMISSRK